MVQITLTINPSNNFTLLNLPIKFARRYLFAKRSTNAINVISGITIMGLSIGTAALILVLSVFNGLEELISSMVNSFNPDIKVAPLEGKVFSIEEEQMLALKSIDGMAEVSATLEEVAFFQYKNSQDVGILKGVDAAYHKVTNIDSALFQGRYQLQGDNGSYVILGSGMYRKLGVNIDDPFNSLKVYMAKRKATGPMSKPFRELYATPRATFNIQADYDNQYVISSLSFARKLLRYKNEVSFLEMKLQPNADEALVKSSIQKIIGEGFSIKNRYEQDEAFNKIMNMEKWMSYAILSLTLLLVAFNMIGALWMIVLDKKKDISILKAMGATNKTVRNIFLNEGLLLSLLGMGIGFAIAIILYILQKTFHIIPSPGFIVESYPITMRFVDFIVVMITVMVVGVIASVAPALKAASIPAVIREE